MSGYRIHAHAPHPAAAASFAVAPAPEFVVDRRPWWRRHPILTTLGVLWLVGFAQEEPAVATVLLVLVLAVVGAGARRRSRDERRREEAAIVARADAQHQAYLSGDPRGIYGFPAEPAPLPEPIPYYRPAAQQPWAVPYPQQQPYAPRMQPWPAHAHHGQYRRYHRWSNNSR
ncbi:MULTISPECIES: hypothetical protein [unclassified Rhodococcus (in: high G+C Gram-positive bacteria)]|uniref:hypothetical protein n=1 Tax=Rhodococcus sp. SJ-3 TaxID=3454628 RepID=UPI003F7A7C70